jgi:hypothetical protein
MIRYRSLKRGLPAPIFPARQGLLTPANFDDFSPTRRPPDVRRPARLISFGRLKIQVI